MASRDAARGVRAGRRRVRAHLGVVLSCAVVAAAGVLLGLGISKGWVLPELRAVGGFLDFYGGVFALVALTLTVMIGLLATGRVILSPGQRVRAQAVHRATAFLAVSFLVVHVSSQLIQHRIGAVQAFVPISGGHLVNFGLGTLACYLLLVAIASGIVRGRFATARRPWAWRALHLTAYAAWPVGVLHGLTAGRTPKPWVVMSYLVCLGGVALALVVRPVLRLRTRRT